MPRKFRNYKEEYEALSSEAKVRAYDASVQWKKRNPEAARMQQRRHYLKKKYGVTVEWFEQKLAEQDGQCGICGSTDPGLWRDFVVDHDHVTGQARALLCTSCNTALGMVKEDARIVAALADYIAFHKGVVI